MKHPDYPHLFSPIRIGNVELANRICHVPTDISSANADGSVNRRVITYHAMGPESIIGLPLRVVGTILIGFMIFAVALQHTGAGKFFLDLALALLGTVRGARPRCPSFPAPLWAA